MIDGQQKEYEEFLSQNTQKLYEQIKELIKFKKHLPFRVDYSSYREMIEEMRKSKGKKEVIINKILLSDIRVHGNLLKEMEKIVDSIITKEINCDDELEITTFLYATLLIQNVLLELYQHVTNKVIYNYNYIITLLEVLKLFNHYFENHEMDIEGLGSYLNSKYIKNYDYYVMAGFILAYSERMLVKKIEI